MALLWVSDRCLYSGDTISLSISVLQRVLALVEITYIYLSKPAALVYARVFLSLVARR